MVGIAPMNGHERGFNVAMKVNRDRMFLKNGTYSYNKAA